MIFKQPVSSEIFFRKYALHGEKSLEEVLLGVSEEIASVEEDKKYWTKVFFNELSLERFIPAGRIVANARLNSLMKNYMNCYVLSIDDDMVSIMETQSNDVLIGKMGGGVGINFSRLRPKNAVISKGGESSGPLSFMEGFDQYAKIIHTGGGRRGAHIAILNVDHPDIEEFITFKQGDINKKLTQFNISVGITDKFMRAVELDLDWDLVFEGKVYKTVRAKDLYNLITNNMFIHNEPGVLFLDEIKRNNNAWYLYDIDCVNPCAEQPLPANGCCCLGAMNLSSFVVNSFTDEAYFDFDLFRESVYNCVRFLDNVISASEYPLEKIKTHVQNERRIGLGFTAYADALMRLGIRYGSEKAIDFSLDFARKFRDFSYSASSRLAEEKGTFPVYSEKMFESEFMKKFSEEDIKHFKKTGLRNIAVNTVAPTGTTSLTLGNNCSSGIEPVFSLQYERTIRQDDDTIKTETVYSKLYLDYLDFLGKTPEDTITYPDWFVTANDINIVDSILVQSVFQMFIDASISKTITLPEDCTLTQYQNLLEIAYSHHLKGYTTYNPKGSLAPILKSINSSKKEKENNLWQKIEVLPNSKKRPESLPCDIYEMQVNKQRVVVLVGRDDITSEPYEVFLTIDSDSLIKLDNAKEGEIRKNGRGKYDLTIKGKKGTLILEDITSVFDDDYAIMCRLLSLAMRHHIPLQFIVDQLNKTKRFDTFSKTMAKVLKKYIVDGEKVISHEVCPECGGELHYQEGCKSCYCGWSRCG